jgi:hypothetical protein
MMCFFPSQVIYIKEMCTKKQCILKRYIFDLCFLFHYSMIGPDSSIFIGLLTFLLVNVGFFCFLLSGRQAQVATREKALCVKITEDNKTDTIFLSSY